MKKILLVLFLSIFLVQGVNAETLYCDYSDTYPTYFEKYGKDFVIGELNSLLNLYNTEYSNDYPFYQIGAYTGCNGPCYLTFTLIYFTENPVLNWREVLIDSAPDLYRYMPTLINYKYKSIYYQINEEDNSLTLVDGLNHSTVPFEYLHYHKDNNTYPDCFIDLPFYTSLNPVFLMPDDDNITQINLQTSPGSNNYDVFTKNSNEYTYKSYSNYIGLDTTYTEVNLDNYEYVVLSLKDYSKTEAFNTNLKVKGMVGITPVYEFGTVEKEYITDRCNLSYEDYTDYRFTILKNDLLNNAVYYVKSCEDTSSFKFDTSIFDVTYITADNADDPVIAVGNKNYNIIPFNKLSTTANSNEDNNFIPGETSGSLSDFINNATNFTSDIWNAVSSFMGLVTKFFNTLPEEIRFLSITGFTVLEVIAIIKFLRG